MVLHMIAVMLYYGKVRGKTISAGKTGGDGSFLHVDHLTKLADCKCDLIGVSISC